MSDHETKITWFQQRVRQKQREANALTIEVGINALQATDPEVLDETLRCLEAAIGILEPASRHPDAPSDAQDLMEDLGHSLAPIDFSLPTYRRLPRPSHRRRNGRRILEELTHDARNGGDDTLRFFE